MKMQQQAGTHNKKLKMAAALLEEKSR